MGGSGELGVVEPILDVKVGLLRALELDDRVYERKQRKNEQKGSQKELSRKRERVSPYTLGTQSMQV